MICIMKLIFLYLQSIGTKINRFGEYSKCNECLLYVVGLQCNFMQPIIVYKHMICIMKLIFLYLQSIGTKINRFGEYSKCSYT